MFSVYHGDVLQDLHTETAEQQQQEDERAKTRSPHEALNNSTDATTTNYYRDLVRSRVKKYLLAVDPKRINEIDELIGRYSDDDFSHEAKDAGCIRLVNSMTSATILGDRVLMSLEKQYRVPESSATGALFTPPPAAPSQLHPHQIQQDFEEEQRRPPAFFQQPQPRRSDYHTKDYAHFATDKSHAKVHHARRAVPARDSVRYMGFGNNPTGFDRRDATCEICGLEALNPCELRRHMRTAHMRL